jgi:Zn-dependent peptidase ImmA (M78 family)
LVLTIFTIVSFIKQPSDFLKNRGLDLCLSLGWELNHSLVNNTDSVCRTRTCDWSSHEGLAHFFAAQLFKSEQMTLLNPAHWQRGRMQQMLKSSLQVWPSELWLYCSNL